ncbi:hypothetical protein BY458DRAFT_495203 [Sporodiniella umbellata]|nr:hypothetical protein BY458DRAFT_495203 [Sporodiniella umbellata]
MFLRWLLGAPSIFVGDLPWEDQPTLMDHLQLNACAHTKTRTNNKLTTTEPYRGFVTNQSLFVIFYKLSVLVFSYVLTLCPTQTRKSLLFRFIILQIAFAVFRLFMFQMALGIVLLITVMIITMMSDDRIVS